MAFLTPDKTRIEHGLVIREKIIPDSARATKYLCSWIPQGGKMKPCRKLSGGTGKAQGVTVHNTPDINEAPGTNDAEQYTRATWPNQNMKGVAVHYFVDEVEAWQNLREDEQGWHAADDDGPGNTTTLAIEIIMDGSGNAADVGAEKNGALLAALLLKKNGLGINKLYRHKDWSGKQCPLYILPHWDKFVATVKSYLAELNGGHAEQPPQTLPTDTSTYTMICGRSVATPAQMRAYLRKKNPAAPDYADLFFQEGAVEGIRGDVAFAQSCVETGCWKFGGDVKAEQNNFCGLGATGDGIAGNRFDTPQIGIRAQVQHLKGYASAVSLVNECVDPRFQYLADRRGCAPYVEWLGVPDNPQGKGWAAGAGYGAAILKVLNEIVATEEQEETVGRDEYEELQTRYEDLWKRYDALTDVVKSTIPNIQKIASELSEAL